MHAQTRRERDQAREYLKEKAATLSQLHEQLRDLKSASNVQVPEIEELRDQVTKLRSVEPRQGKRLS